MVRLCSSIVQYAANGTQTLETCDELHDLTLSLWTLIVHLLDVTGLSTLFHVARAGNFLSVTAKELGVTTTAKVGNADGGGMGRARSN